MQVHRYSILSSIIPFPLTLHALPLSLLVRAWPQVEPKSPFERRVSQY